MNKLSTEQFIEEAKIIHDSKYDYSLTEYINTKTKVKIICPVHGLFEQIPNDHLSGKGCRLCGYISRANKRRKSTKQFIEEAKQVHCDKYDYSLVEYNGNKTKVKIICPIHGVFEQKPNDHLSGKGCRLCSGNVKRTLERFLNLAKQVHGDKYDYSLVEYINDCTKVKIICKKHGIFEQTPNAHLSGKGCKFCSGNTLKSTKQFIEEAKQVHGNRYDYSLAKYNGSKKPIKIICKEHGIFEQLPDKHLNYRQGCPDCSSSKGEERISVFLTNNNVRFEKYKTFSNLKDKNNLNYDFYLNDKNLLIEYNGEQHYYNSFHKELHDFHKQFHHDWLKRKYANDNNINLLVIPYWDFDNIELILQDAIK